MSSFVSSLFSSISPTKKRPSSTSKHPSPTVSSPEDEASSLPCASSPAGPSQPHSLFSSSASSSRRPSATSLEFPSKTPSRSCSSTFDRSSDPQHPLPSSSNLASSPSSPQPPVSSLSPIRNSPRRSNLSSESPLRAGGKAKKRLSAFEEEEETKRNSLKLPSRKQPEVDVWAEDFWVTLEDQKNRATFYANPRTGACVWQPPHGSYVLPIGPDGHWWELVDPTREGSCYYFHTKTKETRWTRPNVPIVLPLSQIQLSTLFHSPSSETPLDYSVNPLPSISSFSSDSNQHQQHHRSISQSFVAHPHPHSSNFDAASASVAATASSKGTRPRSISATNSISTINPFSSLARSLLDRPESTIVPSPPPSTAPSPLRKSLHLLSSTPCSPSTKSPNPKPPTFQRKSSAPPVFSNPFRSEPNTNPHTPRSSFERKRDLPKIPPSAWQSLNTPPQPTPGTAPTRRASEEPSEEAIRARPRTRSVPNFLFGLGGATGHGVEGSKEEHPSMPRLKTTIGSPSVDLDARERMSPMVSNGERQSAPVSTTPLVKRLSHGNHPILPPPLAHDIELFSIAEYASNYFSTKHTEGFFSRKRVPLAKMSIHQPHPISHPLLVLPPKLHSTAIRTFKIIQHQMGERSRAVDLPPLSSLRSSTSSGSLNMLSSPTKGGGGGGMSRGGSGKEGEEGEKEGLLGEVRWLLAVGIAEALMRDEIYMQVLKQLTLCPDPSAVYRGWELLCVLVTTFLPSANLLSQLKSFTKSAKDSVKRPDEDEDSIENKLRIMARHCLIRLSANKPPKSKPPSLSEIATSMSSPFNPTVFSSSLSVIMSLQSTPYLSLRIPIILPFLRTALLALPSTLTTEGLFRIPGDYDQVMWVRERIDRGRYELLQGEVEDPAVLCSVFKGWLRELEEPLIPEERYDEALRTAAAEGDAGSQLENGKSGCCELVKTLPKINRDVIVFVISFLQELLPYQAETKMTDVNFATIFGPNLFRCPADPPVSSTAPLTNDRDISHVPRQFVNSGFERQFVLSLLRYLVPSEFDDLPDDSDSLFERSPF